MGKVGGGKEGMPLSGPLPRIKTVEQMELALKTPGESKFLTLAYGNSLPRLLFPHVFLLPYLSFFGGHFQAFGQDDS